MSTDMMKGKDVCLYGRGSNKRICNMEVIEVDVVIEDPNGKKYGNMALTDSPASTSGDSGGGWSWNNTAFGVHFGSNNHHSAFTTIEAAEDAMEVTLRER